ncbi:MAG TPA: alpha/beta hydrolase [Acidimicrobiia bacterium]|jgi:pimeloyl-ACP methyl ester carboxylesterase|nr:alpha/beta hydrolase [Acidimicrobiia bacterium]HIL46676.1 alpha/beta hydrolase [Acidimicrobiia bacterium]
MRKSHLLLLAVLLAGACGIDNTTSTTAVAVTSEVPQPTTSATTSTVAGSLAWKGCWGVAECADLTVLMDYANPSGETVSIAVVRVAAVEEPYLGPLFLNPGGPGGSGLDMVGEFADLWSMVFPQFDVVGFDPRGVGASSAVLCPTDYDTDDKQAFDAGDDLSALFVEQLDYVEQCQELSGELLLHVGTNNAARDIDEMRIALGVEQITYLGYSYGTRLGAVYAGLFPDRVRAMVLDGPLDPAEQLTKFSSVQGDGFESAWSRFAADCRADAACALNEFGGPEAAFFAADALLEEQNFLVGEGRELSRAEFVFGVGVALYSPQSWPDLVEGVVEVLEERQGNIFQGLVDDMIGRQPDGSYDNSNAANLLINCADDPGRPSQEEIVEANGALASTLPHFGPVFRGTTGCFGVPAAVDPLLSMPTDMAVPALVIAMEGDPATPMAWAEGLRAAVGDAVLITTDGDGHGAFLSNSECVTEVVFAYLYLLVVPVDGWSCEEPALYG